MAGEWKETTLGAEADLLTGFPFKSERYTDSADSIPLVRGDNIVQGAMRWDGVKRWPLSERGDHELYELREGDVVLAMDRPWIEAGLKYAAISKHDLPCLLVQRTARLRGGPKLDTRFLRYLIGSREFTQHIHAITTGTAVPHISGRQIKDFTFALPPLAEQKAIAAVLGALDDKIELNRRMNATLEAMARALFQSWFIDFDPVRQNMDQNQPSTRPSDHPSPSGRRDGEEGIVAYDKLFPDSFQDSELGHIPKGWEVGRLDDALVLQRGFDLPATERTHGKYPVLAASGPNGCHDKFMVKGPGVTTGRSGVLGKVFFIHGDFWPLNTSLWVKEFKRVSPAYAFHLIGGLDFEAFNAGSAVPTLNRNHVHNLPVVIPPKYVVEAFDTQVMPLMKQQQANEDQSRTLATLRDTLLPNLLSGELSVAQKHN